jgi:hypothetical protein
MKNAEGLMSTWCLSLTLNCHEQALPCRACENLLTPMVRIWGSRDPVAMSSQWKHSAPGFLPHR